MKNHKLTLLCTLLLVGFVPLVSTAVLLNVFGAVQQRRTLQESVYERLEAAANGLRMYYEWDIINAGEAAYEHDYVDSLKGQDIELSLFIGDSRFITSITDEKGERTEGQKMDSSIYEVIQSGQDYKADHIKLGGSTYYGYYVPVKDGSGSVVGAAFAGEPAATVSSVISRTILSSTLIAVLGVIIFGVVIIFVARMIKKRLANILNAVGVMAEGDLTEEKELSSTIYEFDNLGKSVMTLRTNMKTVISSVLENVEVFHSDMEGIMENVEICNNASDEITKAVDDLAQGSVTMSGDIADTSGNMQEMGEEINEVHHLADSANEASKQVQEESNTAREKVKVLMTANEKTIAISGDVVKGIQESAEAIGKIQTATDMITSITSQTALLSLNASIEAARAGEAGKGFAVVASEISNLAAQSDQSTKEIQDIVKEIMEASEHNVELSNRIKEAIDNEGSVLMQVRDSFRVMKDKVVENVDAIRSISDKAMTLDNAKAKVLDAVSGLSAVSEQNAASCQETNASMEEMGATITNIHEQSSNTMEACEKLKEACSYFKVTA